MTFQVYSYPIGDGNLTPLWHVVVGGLFHPQAFVVVSGGIVDIVTPYV